MRLCRMSTGTLLSPSRCRLSATERSIWPAKSPAEVSMLNLVEMRGRLSFGTVRSHCPITVSDTPLP